MRTIYTLQIVAAIFIAIGGLYDEAAADYAQTLGIGQKSSNLGQAVTAGADDYDVFFTNPAGAANFSTFFIGGGAKVLDTRTIEATQVDAVSPEFEGAAALIQVFTGFEFDEEPAEGLDLSPEGTLPGQSVAVIPSLGGYAPLPWAPNVVVGLGFGAPYVLSADYGNDDVPGNYGRFNTTDASIIFTEVAPSIGVKVNDRLNIGGSLGITAFKYLRLGTTLGTPVGAGVVGTADLETDNDFSLPFAPSEFSTSPTDVSFTVGAQYQLTPKLTIGATYRSETPQTFEGPLLVDINQFDLGDTPIGGFTQEGRFETELEFPRHVQVGVEYAATPRWDLMGDVRWTNWSNTKGFGSPTVFKLSGINLGGGIQDQLPFLGGTAGFPPSASIDTVSIPSKAEDTFSFHFGTSYDLTPEFELQAGYIYDPSFVPDDSVDLLTFSSDRHIFSLGGTYTLDLGGSDWEFTLGGQLIQYEQRTIDPGQSISAGGINNSFGVVFEGQEDIAFQENSLGGLELGGFIWSVGASVSSRF